MNGGTPDGRVDVDKLRALLPELGSAGLETAAASTRPTRGKVLKLKLGFNPNSSSVGTTVVVFLWTLVASGAVLAFASAVLAHRFQRRRAPDATESS
jgi:hypothetical protein